VLAGGDADSKAGMARSGLASWHDSETGAAVATLACWWGLGLGGGPPVGTPGGCNRAEVALGSAWRNPSSASRQLPMATLLAPVPSLEILPVR